MFPNCVKNQICFQPEYPVSTNSKPMIAAKRSKASIIINCLNGEKYLRHALDSVFMQSFDDWEVFFWDNLSTDKSAEIAKNYGEKVRYFKSAMIHPLGKARNLAIEKTRGDFIAFLDCFNTSWRVEQS